MSSIRSGDSAPWGREKGPRRLFELPVALLDSLHRVMYPREGESHLQIGFAKYVSLCFLVPFLLLLPTLTGVFPAEHSNLSLHGSLLMPPTPA